MGKIGGFIVGDNMDAKDKRGGGFARGFKSIEIGAFGFWIR